MAMNQQHQTKNVVCVFVVSFFWVMVFLSLPDLTGVMAVFVEVFFRQKIKTFLISNQVLCRRASYGNTFARVA